MPCEWTYEITAKQRFQNITLSIAGQQLQLVPSTPEVQLIKAEGKVTFDCKDTGQCKPKVYNLSYINPPQVTLANLGSLYGFSPASQAAANAAGVSITQPTLTGKADIRLIPMGDGSCLNVQVIPEITVSAGSASYDPPDITIPTTPPVSIPTPVVTISWGASYTDFLTAEYILCCCRYDTSLEEAQATDTVEGPDPWVPTDVFHPDECGIDCEFTFSYVRRTNPSAPATWRVKAMEGECAFSRVMVVQPDGTRRAKRKRNPPKAERERHP